MQAIIDKIKSEGPQVIQGDALFKSDIKWRDDIVYEPPNDYEINMLKGTLKPEELIKIEKEEEEIKTDAKRDLITKVKVVALDRMNVYPLTNPSFFSKKDKRILIKHMEDILDLPREELDKMFNEVCIESVFTEKADYSLFSIKSN